MDYQQMEGIQLPMTKDNKIHFFYPSLPKNLELVSNNWGGAVCRSSIQRP